VIKRNNKASVLLEFTLIVPMAILLILFSVDVGRYIIYQTNLKESVAVASRTAARIGYAGSDSGATGSSCPQGLDTDVARNSFCKSILSIPGGGVDITNFTIEAPGSASYIPGLEHVCSSTDKFVIVKASVRVKFVSLFIKNILESTGKDIISAKAVSFCEVGYNE